MPHYHATRAHSSSPPATHCFPEMSTVAHWRPLAPTVGATPQPPLAGARCPGVTCGWWPWTPGGPVGVLGVHWGVLGVPVVAQGGLELGPANQPPGDYSDRRDQRSGLAPEHFTPRSLPSLSSASLVSSRLCFFLPPPSHFAFQAPLVTHSSPKQRGPTPSPIQFNPPNQSITLPTRQPCLVRLLCAGWLAAPLRRYLRYDATLPYP